MSLPGTFHLTGKQAFDREIENEAFTGRPVVTITRMVEEDDVVIAEGAYCDAFEMENGRIRRLISYLVDLKESPFTANPQNVA
jgi:uncharacterized protein